MELFTVLLTKPFDAQTERLRQRLVAALDGMPDVREWIRIDCASAPHEAVIRCTALLPGFRLHEGGTPLYKTAADALAAFILEDIEDMILREIITGKYRYTDERDVAAIERFCRQLRNETDGSPASVHARQRQKAKIAQAVFSYLGEYTQLNLHGFVRFRLPDYAAELKELADYAVGEFVKERQYEEFIELLRYFVYVQEAKIPVTHLMHRGGQQFSLYDEQMDPIDPGNLDGFSVTWLDKETNFEDMIVSTLITVAPQKVFIHTREPDAQVVKTIVQIFGKRAVICSYCALCQPVLGAKSVDQRYP